MLSASGAQDILDLVGAPNSFKPRRPHRAVVRCDGTYWGLYEDGARVAEATRDLGAVNVTSFGLGSGENLDPFFGHLRRLTYWPAPLATTTVEVLAR